MNEDSQKCAQCDAELPADSSSALCPKCLLRIGFETNKPQSDEHKSTAYQASFIPPTAEELAPLFTQLEILEVIGHGGMGIVYKARQTELDRIVALKILRPGIVDDAGFAERFQREARALAKLNHPNIITVYDFGRRDELYYFLMEYVDGTNLRHLEREGDLTSQEALAIVPQICSALQYAHDNGVVHRDIKPENILITREGDVRIADFGLAKLAGAVDDAPLTGTWQVMGTPHYMAPEQFEKPTSVDHRADIYSLGVVIYELLTGELPLGRFPLPSQKARVDVRMDEVVLRSLDKEPDRRYQHVTDVATAVQEASEPPETSRVGQAADWLRSKATAFGERAQTLTKSRSDLKTPLHRLVHWLGEHRRTLGIVLVWCAVIDAFFALATLAGMFGLVRDDEALLVFMSLIAAVITFLLGRQLRHNRASSTQRIISVFALLPWFHGFPLLMLARIVLIAGALLSTISKDHPLNGKANDESDHFDKLVGWMSKARKVFSLRALLFVLYGLAGWTTICVIAGVFTLQFILPKNVTIHDNTAQDLKPASDAYQAIDIRSETNHTAAAFEDVQSILARDELKLFAREERTGTATLVVDLIDNTSRIMRGSAQISEDMPVDEKAVIRWMTENKIDPSVEGVEAEVDHLTEVLQLMQTTRGLIERIPNDVDRLFPTLSDPIARMKQTRSIMTDGMIPVGALIDSSLFDRPSTGYSFHRFHRVSSRSEDMFLAGAVAVWLAGLLRVIRVLYLQLFSSRFRVTDVERHITITRWRWCSVSLSLAGLAIVSCAAIMLFNRPIEASLDEFASAIGPEGWNLFRAEAALIFGMMLGATVIISGLLARPWLRWFGRWAGYYGGTVSMLAVPFNLLTFPTGLASCIALTDRNVRHVFQRTTSATSEQQHDAQSAESLDDGIWSD